MTSETLRTQCERELQKQLLRRTKKLEYILGKRDHLKRVFNRVNCIPAVLSLSRLSKREERLTDVQFDCLDFGISQGKVVSKINARKFIKRQVWGIVA